MQLKHVIVDYRISDEEKDTLAAAGFEIMICPPFNKLYPAVSGHPDMLLHIIDKDTIIVHKEMEEAFVSALRVIGKNILFSEYALGSQYPYDIILNAVNLKHIFIHNTKYSDHRLLDMMGTKKIVCVKQGYTKCSTAVLNDKAIITSDAGIFKAAKINGLDALFVPPGDILLPGLNYGFIGGCCGLLDDGLLAFYGDLKNYAYGTEIINFLKKYKIEPFFLSRGKLTDRGTLFVI